LPCANRGAQSVLLNALGAPNTPLPWHAIQVPSKIFLPSAMSEFFIVGSEGTLDVTFFSDILVTTFSVVVVEVVLVETLEEVFFAGRLVTVFLVVAVLVEAEAGEAAAEEVAGVGLLMTLTSPKGLMLASTVAGLSLLAEDLSAIE